MAVIAGVVADSISLVGFAIDSVIEVATGSTLWWGIFYAKVSHA